MAAGCVGLRSRVTMTCLVACVLITQVTAIRGESRSLRGDDVTWETSFEESTAGPFRSLETAVGRWRPESGRVIVDDAHAAGGSQCLQLTGGERSAVILELAEGVPSPFELSFRAERWTRRSPFLFRIEQHSAAGWEEIYNGDQLIRVGRPFLSQVRVTLSDPSVRRLRFTCSSPPDTGILIDDIRCRPPTAMRVLSVTAQRKHLPMMVRNTVNPILDLQVTTEGSLSPLVVTEIQAEQVPRASVIGQSPWPVEVWSAGIHEDLPAPQLQETDALFRRFAQSRNQLMIFAGHSELGEGRNHFYFSPGPPSGTDAEAAFDVRVHSVTINGQTVAVQQEKAKPARMGVAVRHGGDDGVHTYRIPGLATTNQGTLIGVYDVRRRSGGDLPGDIDVGMSRSTDGGQTWEPMRIIMDMGDDPKWRYDGVGDPAVLVDRRTGTIWVAATWSHGNRSWNGSGPGLLPEETGQLMLTRSDDDGMTWSSPINITQQVKRPEWSFLLQGPGKGICMEDGTLVFAAQYQDPPAARRLPHSTIIYSRDHGASWSVGTGAFDDTTEAQVIETEPGVLMLNCRYNRGNTRVIMVTRDMGRTWQEHPSSRTALIEPRACMGSLINVDRECQSNVGGWLLFSNPDSTSGRHHITIKASSDGGRTWPRRHRLLLDEGRSAGYSCLSMIDSDTVGILYEGSRAQMTFQRIPLKSIVGDQGAEQHAERSAMPASLTVPPVFSDHMVLQAELPLPVWGRAMPNAEVRVTLGKATKITRADESGKWSVNLPQQASSDVPVCLLIQSGEEEMEFRDILMGEVWFCAGQSNMAWPLRNSAGAEQELASADDAQFRLLLMQPAVDGHAAAYSGDQLGALEPHLFLNGRWQRATAESAASFSAVAWHFGRELRKRRNVPVGLLCAAVGGTPTEAWISRSALGSQPQLAALTAGNWLWNGELGEFCRLRAQQNLLAAIQAGDPVPMDTNGPQHPFRPGYMWEAAIAPTAPYAVRGVIWYQGESNAETAKRVAQHNHLFPLFVDEWRAVWRRTEMPIGYVQLPGIDRPEWPAFRESQRRLLKARDELGMTVMIDQGHPTNVHPPEKAIVGRRLARWALAEVYRQPLGSSCSGPLLRTVRRVDDAILVEFEHCGDGLQSADGELLRHFEVCGSDGEYHVARAVITGRRAVLVSSSQVPEPEYVRYAWVPYPAPPVNLVNSDGLPASPFTSEP